MTRAALLAACLALPAAAQEVTMHATPDALAVITLRNESTFGKDALHRWRTPAGEVVIRHQTTPNAGGGCCPDTLTAVDWPDGYYPDPLVLEVPEGGVAALMIRPMVGM